MNCQTKAFSTCVQRNKFDSRLVRLILDHLIISLIRTAQCLSFRIVFIFVLSTDYIYSFILIFIHGLLSLDFNKKKTNKYIYIYIYIYIYMYVCMYVYIWLVICYEPGYFFSLNRRYQYHANNFKEK